MKGGRFGHPAPNVGMTITGSRMPWLELRELIDSRDFHEVKSDDCLFLGSRASPSSGMILLT